MININASETLILTCAVLGFVHIPLAITALSLGVLGAIIRYSVEYGDKQQKVKEVETTTENISNIISGLASGLSGNDKGNFH
jgi:hypothetical protein